MALPSRKKVSATLTLLFALSGCALQPRLPDSLGEEQSSYSYIPLDPLPVITRRGKSCENQSQPLKAVLDSLPDQAVRIAVGQYDASGTLIFGPAKIGTQGKSYQVILDYISVDTANVPLYIERTLVEPDKRPRRVSVFDDTIHSRTQYRVQKDPQSDFFALTEQLKAVWATGALPPGDKVIIPVYVGVGLRLTASITVTKGTANLSSLGSLAADAEAGKITGSLIVQTLGVTGKSVSITLPLPSELNQTTIQNAILSLGSIKAILYDDKTVITPRVVGIYNPIGGGQQLVNGIISLLSNDPIRWYRPCMDTESK